MVTTANREWRVTGLAAGAIAIVVLLAFALGLALTRPTGTHTDSSEYLSTASDNFASRAVSWFPAWVTLPVGYDKGSFGYAVAERLQPATPTFLTRLRLEADFEKYSRCLWMEDWMSAEVSNDLGGMTSAAVVLRESATWPATVATAPNTVTGLTVLARSAAELDLAPVSQDFETHCPALPPSSTN